MNFLERSFLKCKQGSTTFLGNGRISHDMSLDIATCTGQPIKIK